jgi:hypothetical protein
LSGYVAVPGNIERSIQFSLCCLSQMLEYRRCSQQHPNPKSVAVRGSELALVCSLEDVSSYILYIAAYSEEVHIIHYCKPNARVTQNKTDFQHVPRPSELQSSS